MLPPPNKMVIVFRKFSDFRKVFRFSENVLIFGRFSDYQEKTDFLWKIQGHLENNLKVKELLLRLVTCETLDQGIPRSLEYKRVLIAI